MLALQQKCLHAHYVNQHAAKLICRDPAVNGGISSHGSSYNRLAAAAGLGHKNQQHQGIVLRHVVVHAGFGFASKAKSAGSKQSSKDCPCGSGRTYTECCQVFHKSAVIVPKTPEQLIRARYSAFVKKDPKYLRATSHPDNPALQGSSNTLPDGTTKQCSYEEDLAVTFLSIDFTGVKVLSSSVSDDGSSGSVEVEASFKRRVDETGKRVSQPPEQVWRERAHCVKNDEGRWLVREVEALSTTAEEQHSDSAAAAAAAT